jgi:lipopolysaccharide export system protein LptC
LSLFVSGISRTFGGMLLGRPMTADSARMINPRFTGRGGGDTSYVITAASALRRSAEKDAVDLDQPIYSTRDGMTIRAPTGYYDPDSQILELTGGVIFTDKKGNRFLTRSAKLDAKTNSAFGAQPLQGAGPLGSVRADAYEIDAKSGHIRMTGRVSGTLKE